mmetsp:Transcript_17856/g.27601  ORF Transcript_17856/g.27601 Transcript_17856/m.27601 type:complete len:161 (-) Transcript_17856:43-525(-)|eukprot:CAMPEP_0184291972 /NCGR_PEP_ID=MMETSP1049-20130417/3837_1 /TAXON_ID=77928 /ORGANISM="Proteomonas sulcata, Strain CCMP704" /LENGTH=160 /DNA_ID=CAMNT_0026599565 /DNA_START=33 /DNA_END=515 /DNA_ORIENTATION=+
MGSWSFVLLPLAALAAGADAFVLQPLGPQPCGLPACQLRNSAAPQVLRMQAEGAEGLRLSRAKATQILSQGAAAAMLGGVIPREVSAEGIDVDEVRKEVAKSTKTGKFDFVFVGIAGLIFVCIGLLQSSLGDIAAQEAEVSYDRPEGGPKKKTNFLKSRK